MKAAVIDLGTNTFHLIIAEISATNVQIIYKTNVPVRLGQGRINENIIIPEAFERGIETLKNFKQKIDKYQVQQTLAIATSAVRSAANGIDFVESAKKNADIIIDVIDGDKEAEYIYKGVKATGTINGTSLIMDIGGGSTEFIICNDKELLWKKSYNIGAARLMQAYFHSDPINELDKSAIINHLNNELTDLKEACILHKPDHLIGSAGAFETFASMILKETHIENIKSAPIEFTAYNSLSEKLITSTHAARQNMPDLIKLRVDMIVIAAILTNHILSLSEIKQISLSTYDLKMGVLYSLSELKS
ncbi:exopolyphosphatase [Pedobacter panaciterrae]|uniref:Exopolyphosphatase n=1 Tax=Pedobacter panaciterrae TaxID=363849 RepID=A0ABU8NHR2_9SPHI